MIRPATLLRAFLLLLVVAAPAAARQEATGQPLRVFLECGPCDFDFVRTEIGYVDWMRDRADADLHVLARSEVTGSGGRQHTLDFIGLESLAGKADTLTYVQGRDDTQDTTRRGLARVLQMGLVRYLLGTPVADQIEITVPESANGGGDASESTQTSDPWDAWVFSVGGNANSNGESSRSSTNVSGNVSASRVTAGWKVDLGARASYGRQSFSYTVDERDTTVVSTTENRNLNAMIVKSMGGHLSMGARASAGTSTFGNTELFIDFEPAVEYNVFPYDESTRRQWLFTYGAGMRSQQYREETIYSLMEETRPVHSLSTSYSTRQTWGNVNFGVSGQQYLHDVSFYNVNFFGGASINITRGLRLNLNGNYSMVRDELNIAKRSLTTEEVLLRQQQLATDYRYFTSFGLSYRFGSAVQNVVNPRFDGGGGGMIIFF